MKILIIEDDKSIQSFIAQGLKEEGHVVMTSSDGKSGYEMASADQFDFLILDVLLPKMDGFTLCRELRRKGLTLPILMLTAKDAIENRIEGLDAGADDYLVKPFSFAELLARIRAIARRKSGENQAGLELAGLKLDLIRHKASYLDKNLDLTSREFALLEFFMRRQGHVLSRTIIIESVWGYDFHAGTNIIDVYINFLRRKLRKLTQKEWIHTIRNRGYILEAPH